jgi:hypothetical protein
MSTLSPKRDGRPTPESPWRRRYGLASRRPRDSQETLPNLEVARSKLMSLVKDKENITRDLGKEQVILVLIF